MVRPEQNEYAASYAGYVNKVNGTDITGILVDQHKTLMEILNSLDDKKALYAYAEGKWTIKEVIGHIIDSERVFSYRAMCIARGEQQPLPGFEQDGFVLNAKFNNRSLESLRDEYNHFRLANIALIKSLTDEDISRRGTASNNPITVRALIFVIAGHEKHHLDILKDKYLISLQ